jgi:carboxyl-terminal processing protease
VIPDIRYPSLLQHDEIGESALDKALDWDRISPIRHKDYGAVNPILPTLIAKHTERANQDPDFQYIWDQKTLAKTIRGAETIPLNQATRVEQREAQERQYLAIENTRRIAKGLPTLASLDDLFVDSEENDGSAEEADNPENVDLGLEPAEDGDADEEDALITETARILADAINLRGPIMARIDTP